MGDPKRQRKKRSSSRHPWSEEELREELRLIGEYGLRNKKELRTAQSLLRKFRRSARSYQALRGEERENRERELIPKLYRLGLVEKEASLDDVLSLTTSNLLDRRLQTVVFKKGIAKSLHQARQLITHKKILVDGRVVSVPGYIVGRKEEASISALATN
ncbi:MAG: 30S ribosomal protein S4 [Thermoproteota archaeon]